MKFIKAKVTKKFNLGNYQTADYSFEVALNKTDQQNPALVLEALEELINEYFTGRDHNAKIH